MLIQIRQRIQPNAADLRRRGGTSRRERILNDPLHVVQTLFQRRQSLANVGVSLLRRAASFRLRRLDSIETRQHLVEARQRSLNTLLLCRDIRLRRASPASGSQQRQDLRKRVGHHRLWWIAWARSTSMLRSCSKAAVVVA